MIFDFECVDDRERISRQIHEIEAETKEKAIELHSKHFSWHHLLYIDGLGEFSEEDKNRTNGKDITDLVDFQL